MQNQQLAIVDTKIEYTIDADNSNPRSLELFLLLLLLLLLSTLR